MKNRVVIVGGGMIGAAAAIKLAQQGADVTVLERNKINYDDILLAQEVDIRVSAINRASETLLNDLGAMPRLLRTRCTVYNRLEVFESLGNRLQFDCDEINESHLGYLIENSLIQASLWAQFKQLNINVETICEPAIGIEQNTHQVQLIFSDKTYDADLLIGADGGQSHIRKLSNIGVTGWQYEQHCMGILIKLDAPQQNKTWQQFKATGPIAFLPMQAPFASLILYHKPRELIRLKALPPALLKKEIQSQFDSLPGEFSIEKVAVFPLTRQHANTYSNGRVVLVGDSAHTINPLAGQGVNLGFKDVTALGKVLLAKEDLGTPHLLEQYEKQRRVENLAMMSLMDACYFGFSNDIKPIKLLRNGIFKFVDKSGSLKKLMLKHAMGV